MHPLALETSFGAPSGHAQAAAAVWGMAAYDLGKRWFRWLAAAVIFLIGLSRLYLGVHFPHDVLLGWLCGGLILWGLLTLWPHLTRLLSQAGTAHRIALAPVPLKTGLTSAGVFFGFSLGYVLAAPLNFQPQKGAAGARACAACSAWPVWLRSGPVWARSSPAAKPWRPGDCAICAAPWSGYGAPRTFRWLRLE